MADVLPIIDRKDDSAPYIGEINPAFSFPMTSSISTNDPQLTTSIPSRRPADITILPAPAFSFPQLPSTPPFSEPISTSPSRPRPAGHRRGPSEFIGGDGKSGLGLMSTSPTKGENALPNPSTSGRRRGHAHRRSAALSHHDLANIIKRPDSISRQAGSAPATPSEPSGQFVRPTLDRARSQPSLPHGSSLDLSDRPESPAEPSSPSSPSATSRPRVGFSDKLEYIPRPLSVISSATSSSVSTLRPEHSLNNSITSLRSLGTSSPPSARKEIQSDDIFGASLHNEDSPSRNMESRYGGGSSKTRRSSPPPPTSQEFFPLLEGDIDTEVLDTTVQPVPQLQADLSRLRGVPEIRPRSSPEPNDSKRSKRGKSWSDLLSRKSKHEFSTSHEQSRNDEGQHEPEFSLDDINFDEDSTYVVRSPEYDVARSVNSNPSPLNATFDPDVDTDIGTVLDLDEAWYRAGMNNTSENPRIRPTKRAMHSSGTTGAFVPSSMHYHRRAESAPVMPPVEYGLGFPRYGSNPQMQMADVFEEEEDDYNKNSLSRQVSRQNKIARQTKVDALGVNIEESAAESGQLLATNRLATEVSRDTDSSPPSSSSERTLKHGGDLSIQTTSLEPNSAPSVASIENNSSLPIQPNTLRTYASSHTSYPSQSDRVSNFHSNEASPLQTSFEVPRLGTAHSSGTDRSAWSSARNVENTFPNSTSIDDVPSLVSSSSTMISHIPHTPVVGSRLNSERAQSLTTDSYTRPRTPLQAAKRASLASLSKLMGGSFSEKSKLSIESKAEYDDEVSSTKTKKRHRISRLMKSMFWKSKEDIRSLATTDGMHSA